MTSVRRGLRLAIPAVLCLALTAAPGLTQGPPAASPESVGLSSERLERVDRVMKEYVDQGRIPGVVTLIARHGKVAQFQSYGKLDLEKNAPMQKDTIFRIASMSKAVTSIAALMLLEDGKLLLSDPVSKVHSRVQEHDRCGAAASRRRAEQPRRGGPGQARDHDSRSAHAHLRRVIWQRPRRGAVQSRQHLDVVLRRQERADPAVIERLASLPFDAQPGEKYIYCSTPISWARSSRRLRACRWTSSSARESSSP
jgi:CubicO group peptidase (beta-lactamase class C family)